MKFKFNVPNKITLIRISLIPLFVAVLLAKIPYGNILSAFIFLVLSVSDFFDGYIARKKRQVTDFGKLIDPIADKFLVSAALVFLVGKGVELWMAAAIISREVILTAIRIYLLPSKLIVPASNFGRAKTVVQSIAIVAVLLQLSFGYYMMVAAVLLTLISGIEYLFRIRRLTGNKIVNLPNLITLARFLLIIPFVHYFINSRSYAAIIIFAAITLSDKLDGISARLMNQRTEFGSAFDSFTDWIFISAALAVFILKAYIPLKIGILLGVFMIFIAIMKFYYISQYKKISAMAISKISVGIAYVTILVFLIDFAYKSIFIAVAAVMAVITAITFLTKIRKLDS